MSDQETAEYRHIGDLMQSEASRLLEWADEIASAHPTTVETPYEVQMAKAGLRSAIEEWTHARIGFAPARLPYLSDRGTYFQAEPASHHVRRYPTRKEAEAMSGEWRVLEYDSLGKVVKDKRVD